MPIPDRDADLYLQRLREANSRFTPVARSSHSTDGKKHSTIRQPDSGTVIKIESQLYSSGDSNTCFQSMAAGNIAAIEPLTARTEDTLRGILRFIALSPSLSSITPERIPAETHLQQMDTLDPEKPDWRGAWKDVYFSIIIGNNKTPFYALALSFDKTSSASEILCAGTAFYKDALTDLGVHYFVVEEEGPTGTWLYLHPENADYTSYIRITPFDDQENACGAASNISPLTE